MKEERAFAALQIGHNHSHLLLQKKKWEREREKEQYLFKDRKNASFKMSGGELDKNIDSTVMSVH